MLAEAHAGVLAVNREVNVTFTGTGDNSGLNIATQGFMTEPVLLPPTWPNEPAPAATHPGYLLWHVTQQLQQHGPVALPTQGQLTIDSSAFYAPGQQEKLGLGSSAAVTVALYALGCAIAHQPMSLSGALAAHHAAQGKAGSGIDVAASYYGGLLRYRIHQHAQVAAASWPEQWRLQALFVGKSASTPQHLGRFADWRAQAQTQSLDHLVAASNACARDLSLRTLSDYTEALRAFDQDSKLGIFAQGHENLHKLARRNGLLYKPCGAGGGDLGVAISDDPDRLAAFVRAATGLTEPAVANTEVHSASITAVPLGMAEHGVRTSIEHHLPNP